MHENRTCTLCKRKIERKEMAVSEKSWLADGMALPHINHKPDPTSLMSLLGICSKSKRP